MLEPPRSVLSSYMHHRVYAHLRHMQNWRSSKNDQQAAFSEIWGLFSDQLLPQPASLSQPASSSTAASWRALNPRETSPPTAFLSILWDPSTRLNILFLSLVFCFNFGFRKKKELLFWFFSPVKQASFFVSMTWLPLRGGWINSFVNKLFKH